MFAMHICKTNERQRFEDVWSVADITATGGQWTCVTFWSQNRLLLLACHGLCKSQMVRNLRSSRRPQISPREREMPQVHRCHLGRWLRHLWIFHLTRYVERKGACGNSIEAACSELVDFWTASSTRLEDPLLNGKTWLSVIVCEHLFP